MSEYIDIRISQLKDDLDKASNPEDRAWYNRLIQELSWAKSQDHNCYIGTDASGSWFKQEQTNQQYDSLELVCVYELLSDHMYQEYSEREYHLTYQ